MNAAKLLVFLGKVCENKMKNTEKKAKRSSKSPILVFKRVKSHFAFFEDLFVFFSNKQINTNGYYPFHQILWRDGENGKFFSFQNFFFNFKNGQK